MKILSTSDLLAKVPYSRVQVWRLIRAGKFPAPLQLSARRIGFLESDVNTWIEARARVEYAPKKPRAAAPKVGVGR